MDTSATYTMHRLRAELAAAREAADVAEQALCEQCESMASLKVGETLTLPRWGERDGFWASGHVGKQAVVERIEGFAPNNGQAEVHYHMRVLRKDGEHSVFRCILVQTLS